MSQSRHTQGSNNKRDLNQEMDGGSQIPQANLRDIINQARDQDQITSARKSNQKPFFISQTVNQSQDPDQQYQDQLQLIINMDDESVQLDELLQKGHPNREDKDMEVQEDEDAEKDFEEGEELWADHPVYQYKAQPQIPRQFRPHKKKIYSRDWQDAFVFKRPRVMKYWEEAQRLKQHTKSMISKALKQFTKQALHLKWENYMQVLDRAWAEVQRHAKNIAAHPGLRIRMKNVGHSRPRSRLKRDIIKTHQSNLSQHQFQKKHWTTQLPVTNEEKNSSEQRKMADAQEYFHKQVQLQAQQILRELGIVSTRNGRPYISEDYNEISLNSTLSQMERTLLHVWQKRRQRTPPDIEALNYEIQAAIFMKKTTKVTIDKQEKDFEQTLKMKEELYEGSFHNSAFTDANVMRLYLMGAIQSVDWEKYKKKPANTWTVNPIFAILKEAEVEDYLQIFSNPKGDITDLQIKSDLVLNCKEGTNKLFANNKEFQRELRTLFPILNTFQLPEQALSLSKLMNNDYISKSDLSAGYSQVSLHPMMRDHTCFVWRKKLFRYSTLPFGLSSSSYILTTLYSLLLLKAKGLFLKAIASNPKRTIRDHSRTVPVELASTEQFAAVAQITTAQIFKERSSQQCSLAFANNLDKNDAGTTFALRRIAKFLEEIHLLYKKFVYQKAIHEHVREDKHFQTRINYVNANKKRRSFIQNHSNARELLKAMQRRRLDRESGKEIHRGPLKLKKVFVPEKNHFIIRSFSTDRKRSMNLILNEKDYFDPVHKKQNWGTPLALSLLLTLWVDDLGIFTKQYMGNQFIAFLMDYTESQGFLQHPYKTILQKLKSQSKVLFLGFHVEVEPLVPIARRANDNKIKLLFPNMQEEELKQLIAESKQITKLTYNIVPKHDTIIKLLSRMLKVLDTGALEDLEPVLQMLPWLQQFYRGVDSRLDQLQASLFRDLQAYIKRDLLTKSIVIANKAKLVFPNYNPQWIQKDTLGLFKSIIQDWIKMQAGIVKKPNAYRCSNKNNADNLFDGSHRYTIQISAELRLLTILGVQVEIAPWELREIFRNALDDQAFLLMEVTMDQFGREMSNALLRENKTVIEFYENNSYMTSGFEMILRPENSQISDFAKITKKEQLQQLYLQLIHIAALCIIPPASLIETKLIDSIPDLERVSGINYVLDTILRKVKVQMDHKEVVDVAPHEDISQAFKVQMLLYGHLKSQNNPKYFGKAILRQVISGLDNQVAKNLQNKRLHKLQQQMKKNMDPRRDIEDLDPEILNMPARLFVDDNLEQATQLTHMREQQKSLAVSPFPIERYARLENRVADELMSTFKYARKNLLANLEFTQKHYKFDTLFGHKLIQGKQYNVTAFQMEQGKQLPTGRETIPVAQLGPIEIVLLHIKCVNEAGMRFIKHLSEFFYDIVQLDIGDYALEIAKGLFPLDEELQMTQFQSRIVFIANNLEQFLMDNRHSQSQLISQVAGKVDHREQLWMNIIRITQQRNSKVNQEYIQLCENVYKLLHSVDQLELQLLADQEIQKQLYQSLITDLKWTALYYKPECLNSIAKILEKMGTIQRKLEIFRVGDENEKQSSQPFFISGTVEIEARDADIEYLANMQGLLLHTMKTWQEYANKIATKSQKRRNENQPPLSYSEQFMAQMPQQVATLILCYLNKYIDKLNYDHTFFVKAQHYIPLRNAGMQFKLIKVPLVNENPMDLNSFIRILSKVRDQTLIERSIQEAELTNNSTGIIEHKQKYQHRTMWSAQQQEIFGEANKVFRSLFTSLFQTEKDKRRLAGDNQSLVDEYMKEWKKNFFKAFQSNFKISSMKAKAEDALKIMYHSRGHLGRGVLASDRTFGEYVQRNDIFEELHQMYDFVNRLYGTILDKDNAAAVARILQQKPQNELSIQQSSKTLIVHQPAVRQDLQKKQVLSEIKNQQVGKDAILNLQIDQIMNTTINQLQKGQQNALFSSGANNRQGTRPGLRFNQLEKYYAPEDSKEAMFEKQKQALQKYAVIDQERLIGKDPILEELDKQIIQELTAPVAFGKGVPTLWTQAIASALLIGILWIQMQNHKRKKMKPNIICQINKLTLGPNATEKQILEQIQQMPQLYELETELFQKNQILSTLHLWYNNKQQFEMQAAYIKTCYLEKRKGPYWSTAKALQQEWSSIEFPEENSSSAQSQVDYLILALSFDQKIQSRIFASQLTDNSVLADHQPLILKPEMLRINRFYSAVSSKKAEENLARQDIGTEKFFRYLQKGESKDPQIFTQWQQEYEALNMNAKGNKVPIDLQKVGSKIIQPLLAAVCTTAELENLIKIGKHMYFAKEMKFHSKLAVQICANQVIAAACTVNALDFIKGMKGVNQKDDCWKELPDILVQEKVPTFITAINKNALVKAQSKDWKNNVYFSELQYWKFSKKFVIKENLMRAIAWPTQIKQPADKDFYEKYAYLGFYPSVRTKDKLKVVEEDKEQKLYPDIADVNLQYLAQNIAELKELEGEVQEIYSRLHSSTVCQQIQQMLLQKNQLKENFGKVIREKLQRRFYFSQELIAYKWYQFRYHEIKKDSQHWDHKQDKLPPSILEKLEVYLLYDNFCNLYYRELQPRYLPQNQRLQFDNLVLRHLYGLLNESNVIKEGSAVESREYLFKKEVFHLSEYTLNFNQDRYRQYIFKSDLPKLSKQSLLKANLEVAQFADMLMLLKENENNSGGPIQFKGTQLIARSMNWLAEAYNRGSKNWQALTDFQEKLIQQAQEGQIIQFDFGDFGGTRSALEQSLKSAIPQNYKVIDTLNIMKHYRLISKEVATTQLTQSKANWVGQKHVRILQKQLNQKWKVRQQLRDKLNSEELQDLKVQFFEELLEKQFKRYGKQYMNDRTSSMSKWIAHKSRTKQAILAIMLFTQFYNSKEILYMWVQEILDANGKVTAEDHRKVDQEVNSWPNMFTGRLPKVFSELVKYGYPSDEHSFETRISGVEGTQILSVTQYFRLRIAKMKIETIQDENSKEQHYWIIYDLIQRKSWLSVTFLQVYDELLINQRIWNWRLKWIAIQIVDMEKQQEEQVGAKAHKPLFQKQVRRALQNYGDFHYWHLKNNSFEKVWSSRHYKNQNNKLVHISFTQDAVEVDKLAIIQQLDQDQLEKEVRTGPFDGKCQLNLEIRTGHFTQAYELQIAEPKQQFELNEIQKEMLQLQEYNSKPSLKEQLDAEEGGELYQSLEDLKWLKFSQGMRFYMQTQILGDYKILREDKFVNAEYQNFQGFYKKFSLTNQYGDWDKWVDMNVIRKTGEQQIHRVLPQNSVASICLYQMDFTNIEGSIKKVEHQVDFLEHKLLEKLFQKIKQDKGVGNIQNKFHSQLVIKIQKKLQNKFQKLAIDDEEKVVNQQIYTLIDLEKSGLLKGCLQQENKSPLRKRGSEDVLMQDSHSQIQEEQERQEEEFDDSDCSVEADIDIIDQAFYDTQMEYLGSRQIEQANVGSQSPGQQFNYYTEQNNSKKILSLEPGFQKILNEGKNSIPKKDATPQGLQDKLKLPQKRDFGRTSGDKNDKQASGSGKKKPKQYWDEQFGTGLFTSKRFDENGDEIMSEEDDGQIKERILNYQSQEYQGFDQMRQIMSKFNNTGITNTFQNLNIQSVQRIENQKSNQQLGALSIYQPHNSNEQLGGNQGLNRQMQMQFRPDIEISEDLQEMLLNFDNIDAEETCFDHSEYKPSAKKQQPQKEEAVRLIGENKIRNKNPRQVKQIIKEAELQKSNIKTRAQANKEIEEKKKKK